MYTIRVKDTSPDLEIFVSRAMLLLASLAAVLYPVSNYFICIFCSIVLFFAALFVKKIFIVFKINQFFLLLFAAILLVIATHSFLFAILLIVIGKLVKNVYRTPEIIINEEGVTINKTLGSKQYKWTSFNNIVLKDNLLTLDFVNNKLLQVNSAETAIEESVFNAYCNNKLAGVG